MPHLVLLGDSVLDNGAHVQAGPAVLEQVRQAMPPAWTVTLLAVDGSVTRDVNEQVDAIPPDASHLFLSTGGNDALGQQAFLGRRADSVVSVLSDLDGIVGTFRGAYGRLLTRLATLRLRTTVCTVYHPAYEDPAYVSATVTALAVLNDVIVQEAAARGFDILDLRKLFTAPSDYANPIEPSVQGGAKIAGAIRRIVNDGDESRRVRSTLWP